MNEDTNYTPLDTEKLSPRKKLFKIPNKVLIGLILFFTVGVGAVGFLLTQQRQTTQVPAQIDTTITEIPTETPVPSPTGEVAVTITETPVTVTGEPTATQAPEATVAAEEIITPTETQTPTSTPTSTEAPTPTSEPAGIGGAGDEPTATPTEIILAQATSAPEETAAAESTQAPEIPSAGVATFSVIFAVISFTVIFLGLIL